MKRLGLITTLVASLFVFMIAGSMNVNAQGKSKGKYWKSGTVVTKTHRIRTAPTWRRKGPYMGYRNYGQYRRTQVGNRRVGHRRYRLVRRPYWEDGVRLTRMVRVYY